MFVYMYEQVNYYNLSQLKRWWLEDDSSRFNEVTVQDGCESTSWNDVVEIEFAANLQEDATYIFPFKGMNIEDFEKHGTIISRIYQNQNKWRAPNERKTLPISFMMAAWQEKIWWFLSSGHPLISWIISHHQTSWYHVAICFVVQLHLVLSYCWFWLIH